jgi:hypothetical protein
MSYRLRQSQFPRWQLMLEGYYDDSGKENDGTYVCLAGYLAPNDSHWTPFVEKWRHLLVLHGLEELHLKTFLRVAEKKGWDKPKRDAVLSDFIDVVRNAQLIGFGVGVDVKVWKVLPKERRKRFGTAQEFAMQRILRMTIEKLMAVGIKDHVNVVFDQDEEFCSPRLMRYFAAREADRLFKEMVPIISFADARVCYPLQAADLLAWFSRRRLSERENPETTEKTPDSRYLRLVTPPDGEVLHYEWEFWGEKNTEKALTKVEAEWANALRASSSAEPPS